MSRKEIIDWVNDTLLTKIKKIGDLGEGSHYCQLLDMIFPDLGSKGKIYTWLTIDSISANAQGEMELQARNRQNQQLQSPPRSFQNRRNRQGYSD